MPQIKVDANNYSGEVNNAKTAADNLATENGVAKPGSDLNTKVIKEMWNEYNRLTNAINQYATLVTYDVGRFKQAGKNQVELDESYGKKGGK